jgi:hypothetical protein
MLASSARQQLVLLRHKYHDLGAEECKKFIKQHICLLCGTEIAISFVEEWYPGVQDCSVDQYSCPYIFSSATFLTRCVVGAAILVFNLTLWLPFSDVISLLVIHCVLSKIHGFLFFTQHRAISAWAFGCTCMQIAIFLVTRYQYEVRARKGYLLQLHILQLRANLQRLLDHMLPRSISDRLSPGMPLVDFHQHATVLVCSFVADGVAAMDPMDQFIDLDRIHQVRSGQIAAQGQPGSSVYSAQYGFYMFY